MGTYFIDPQKYFTVKEFEPGDEPKNAVSHYELLKDKYIKRSVPRGDHVTPEDLVERARLTWPWPFPEYHRAIGLRVYADDLPGGLQCLASWSSFVGSRVNLFARATKDDGTSIELQFEDVLVLAADRIGDKSVDVNSRPLALVTFSLTSEDAIKVTLASHIGRFRVAVRYANDK